MVNMKYAKRKVVFLKLGFIKASHAIPFERIWDILLFLFIILGLVLLLAAPIWLSLRMPTGS
jgi:hypothetical protein